MAEVVPSEPVLDPSEPDVAPPEPILAPSEPDLAPPAPVLDSSEPALAPTEPDVGPTWRSPPHPSRSWPQRLQA